MKTGVIHCQPDLTYSFRVPLYLSKVKLVVTDDIYRAQRRFGMEPSSGSFYGMSLYKGNQFAILLNQEARALSYDTVAHECFHVTSRIMELVNTKLTPENHEPYAYLNGFIAGKVFGKLKSWKIKSL
jgi:hypothetical protein